MEHFLLKFSNFLFAFSSRDKDKRDHRDRDEKERGESSKVSKEKELAKAEIKSEDK